MGNVTCNVEFIHMVRIYLQFKLANKNTNLEKQDNTIQKQPACRT